MPQPISLLLANYHKLFRKGLSLILTQQEEFKIVGETTNTTETICAVRDMRPDVALLDFTLLETGGTGVIPSIKKESPQTKSIMLLSSRNESMILDALRAGARGYLPRGAGVVELVKAIQAVHQGDLWVERKLISKFFDGALASDFREDLEERKTKEGLTLREHEVLGCLTKGWTNKEIAQTLFISEKTVKTHLNSIFRKLNVTGRLQAILYAMDKGFN